MLSAETLNRVSASYARGYRDGYAGRPAVDEKASTHPFDRPFANFDYARGHAAGANDAKWAAKDRERERLKWEKDKAEIERKRRQQAKALDREQWTG